MAEPQHEIYTLFCVVLGDNVPFPVKIAEDETVGILKKLIKKEKEPKLDHIAADELTLYHTEVTDDDDMAKNVKQTMLDPKGRPSPLRSTKKLKSYFAATPREETIHIIVQIPESLKRKHEPSSLENIALKRAKKVESVAKFPPSTGAQMAIRSKFERDEQIQYNRPPRAKAIPIVLLYNGFGEFVDGVVKSSLTVEDHQFAAEFSSTMAEFYGNEQERNDAFRQIWNTTCGLPKETLLSSIGGNKSDGHIVHGDYVILVNEIKNELGEGKGDPAAQAALYHNASLSLRPDLKQKLEIYPCLIVYIVGPYIGFAGSVVTEAHAMELLTPMYPVHTNFHETEINLQLTRALKSLKQTLAGLHDYYQKLPENLPTSSKAIYPYPKSYENTQGESVGFTYTCRIDEGKLVFKGQTSEENEICIKFTRRYSTEAHQYCADRGVAPQLYAFKELPGGWIMIIMEWLGDNYEHIEKKVSMDVREAAEKALEILHEGGFVHGDVRRANMMACKTCMDSNERVIVKLLDFDWAGLEGQVNYPPHLNRVVKRPEGAIDEAPILKQHDLAMLKHLE